MRTFRTEYEVAVFLQDVILRRSKAFRFRQHQTAVLERVARSLRAVRELTGDGLVDDTELYAVEPSLFRKHRIDLREVGCLRNTEGVSGKRGASLDDLVCRRNLVELVEVHERKLRVQLVVLCQLDERAEVADDVCGRLVRPIHGGFHFHFVVHVIVEVEFIGIGGVGGCREFQHACVRGEFPCDVLQLRLYAVETEIDILAPILHELCCVIVLCESESGLILLDFRTGQFPAYGNERNVTFRALEDRTTLTEDGPVVSVQVGCNVRLCELVLQSAPDEAVYLSDGKMRRKQERGRVRCVQTCLHHLLRQSLDECIYDCCHKTSDF